MPSVPVRTHALLPSIPLTQGLFSALTSRCIQTKDLASACILDEGCEMVYRLLKATLGDAALVRQLSLQRVAKHVDRNPGALEEAGFLVCANTLLTVFLAADLACLDCILKTHVLHAAVSTSLQQAVHAYFYFCQHTFFHSLCICPAVYVAEGP